MNKVRAYEIVLTDIYKMRDAPIAIDRAWMGRIADYLEEFLEFYERQEKDVSSEED